MNRQQRRAAVLIWFVSSVASLEIDTSDGGYKNLLVSISKAVPYDESIIEDIKALFRSSSEFLHRATNGRVYFKQVTIEIPKAWPRRENARNVSLSSFEQSDIRIDLPSEPYGDRPFTQQLRPCGQPGDFIQLTPRFLAQLRNSTGNHPLNMGKIEFPDMDAGGICKRMNYGLCHNYRDPPIQSTYSCFLETDNDTVCAIVCVA